MTENYESNEKLTRYKNEIQKAIEKYKIDDAEIIHENMLEKGLAIIAIISKAIEEFYEGTIIISGGFSVEYYTNGSYATQDIDLIIDRPNSNQDLNELMLKLGLKNENSKAWKIEELGLYIEVVASRPFKGHYLQPQNINVFEDYNVKFVDVNDIIIDRVKLLTHWENDKGNDDQLYDLIAYNIESVSLEWIEEQLNESEYEIFKQIYTSVINAEEEFALREKRIKELLRKLKNLEIPYITDNEGEDEELYLVIFPIYYGGKLNYVALNLLERGETLVYNEVEEVFCQSSWPSELTKNWKDYKQVIKILKEGKWL